MLIAATKREVEVRCTPVLSETDRKGKVRCTPVLSESEVKTAIASFQSGLDDWVMEDVDLSQVASKIRQWMNYWWQEISNSQEHERLASPCFIGFEPRSFVVLGRYNPRRNRTGLTHEISINPGNFCRLSEKQIAAAVVHFVLHCFVEQIEGASEYQYHSTEFRAKANALGIPAHERACSCEIRDDPASPFSVWARNCGLSDVPLMRGGKKQQKRVAWTCECGPAVYIASGIEADLFCGKCHTRLVMKARKTETSLDLVDTGDTQSDHQASTISLVNGGSQRHNENHKHGGDV